MGFWMYVALWLPYTALVIVYGFGSPWYQSAIGRAFFLSKLALCLLTTFILSILIFGRYPFFQEVRAALLAVLAVAAWYQLITVLCIQHQRRRTNRDCPRRRSTDQPVHIEPKE